MQKLLMLALALTFVAPFAAQAEEAKKEEAVKTEAPAADAAAPAEGEKKEEKAAH